MRVSKIQFIGSFLALWVALRPEILMAETASIPAPAVSPASSAPAIPMAGQALKIEVSEIEGTLTVQKNGAAEPIDLTDSTPLEMGDSISSGEGSCKLTIDGKNVIRVFPHTVLKITESLRNGSYESTRLALESGQLMAKLSKIKDGSRFEVSTPTAIAAVRGTTLYLKQGVFGGQPGSQLYVDESKSGVQFTNLHSNETFLVPAFSMSQALMDGSLDPARFLDRESRQEFLRSWLSSAEGVAQQFGIEELPLNNSPANPAVQDFGRGDTFREPFLNDAALEKLAEQNIPGVNGLPPITIPGGRTVAPEPGEEEPRPGEETPGEEHPGEETPGEETPGEETPGEETPGEETPGEETPGEETPGEEEPEPQGPTEEQLNQQERDMIRRQIAAMRGDQDFDQADANLARIADSQTGKTFTDVHGNRVRVDQYIFHENLQGLSYVRLLSLTARTGTYQSGVSALQFYALFNRDITAEDGPLRDLPWNDWLRVVTDEQLTGTEELFFPFEQFIVHEHFSGDIESGPDLYPTSFFALFSNPSTMAFAALEAYGAPEFVDSDQGSFWVQGMFTDSYGVGAQELSIGVGHSPLGGGNATLNGTTVSLVNRSGSQSASLANDARLADLDTAEGLHAFLNSDVHPAFFEDRLNGERLVFGFFLPINDQGRVIDAPGFDVRGLRDLVFPNTTVNGGNYNLQVILGTGYETEGGFYTETGRIDTIITPEIFSPYGLKTTGGVRDTSTVFPSARYPDEQDI